jgi:hypothetical protein
MIIVLAFPALAILTLLKEKNSPNLMTEQEDIVLDSLPYADTDLDLGF